MTEHALALLLASAFTLGCATIHELRRHASVLTPPLTVVALCLTVLVGLVSLATSNSVRPDNARDASSPQGPMRRG